MLNIEVDLTSVTYQINLIFSLKNGEFFRQIVNNTEPNRSLSVVVNDKKTRFKTWFKPPIQLDIKR